MGMRLTEENSRPHYAVVRRRCPSVLPIGDSFD